MTAELGQFKLEHSVVRAVADLAAEAERETAEARAALLDALDWDDDDKTSMVHIAGELRERLAVLAEALDRERDDRREERDQDCAKVAELQDRLAAAEQERDEVAIVLGNVQESLEYLGGQYDTYRRERDAEVAGLQAQLRHPTVAAVAQLVDEAERQHRRAEAAHDAKDEANRRWLDLASRPDNVTR